MTPQERAYVGRVAAVLDSVVDGMIVPGLIHPRQPLALRELASILRELVEVKPAMGRRRAVEWESTEAPEQLPEDPRTRALALHVSRWVFSYFAPQSAWYPALCEATEETKLNRNRVLRAEKGLLPIGDDLLRAAIRLARAAMESAEAREPYLQGAPLIVECRKVLELALDGWTPATGPASGFDRRYRGPA